MNRNVTKTVTHHILPCLGLLIVEAVSCVLAVYGIVILLGHDAPSLYCVLSGILKAVALVILLLISVGSLQHHGRLPVFLHPLLRLEPHTSPVCGFPTPYRSLSL